MCSKVAMHFFKSSISLYTQRLMSVLVFIVFLSAPLKAQEQAVPILTKINFVERVYFREQTLQDMIQHPLGVPVQKALLEDDAKKIEVELQRRGYLKAQVRLSLQKVSPATALATFIFKAGDRAPLKEVYINGNQRVLENEFTPDLFSRERHPVGWLTQAGMYHRPYMDEDFQRILRVFYKHGHLESQVTDFRVSASPDKSWLSLSFDVVEGPKYFLDEVFFQGDVPAADIVQKAQEDVAVFKDAGVNLIALQERLDNVLNVYREQGHAFSRVRLEIPEVVDRDDGDKTARFNAVIEKGPVGKVAKIVLEGNKETKDFVVKRQLFFKEGDTYTLSKVRQSEASLKGLGYFQSVNIVHEPLEGDMTQLLMRVQMREQPTWIANIAPAYVGNEGLVLVGVLAFNNFLGMGTRFSAMGQFSALRQLFDVTYFEPRLLGSRNWLALDVHRRQLGYRYFTTEAVGGGFDVTWQLPWSMRLSTGFKSDLLNLTTPVEVGSEASPLGLMTDVWRQTLSTRLSRDTRNSRLMPTKGWVFAAGVKYAGPWTFSSPEMDWLESSLNLRAYVTPFWNTTFKFNVLYANATAIGGGVVPLSQRFFLGGFGSVRGFTPRSIASLGVAFGQDNIAIGGVEKVVQNTEIEFPVLPGNVFRGFVFLDAGNTYAESEALFQDVGQSGVGLPGGLFWSTGFGFVLKTPVLPFRFEWGLPLTRRVNDRSLDFFFGLGSAF